ncbi:capsid protein [Sigmofec virus UA08Rod_17037]|uniref:Capsid protein n=1 Tax=Sigmofec virus UA08Rod_17037 TaxID=2929262 RepID=A0A976N110_9VIRU|nr:capsid protein [Sigmofec virus UA08Rod_17037]
MEHSSIIKMARFRRYRRRRLRFRPLRRRFYRRRRTRTRRSYRRRTSTRSSSRSFSSTLEYVVSLPLPAGSTKPRGFIPLGLSLPALPGFSEYEYTYSRVRVLSATATVVAQQNGTAALPGGYAIAPSYDLIQSQLDVQAPAGSASLLYRNVEGPSTVKDGQHFGFKVGNTVYETNNSRGASTTLSVRNMALVTGGVVGEDGSDRVYFNPDTQQYKVFNLADAPGEPWVEAPGLKNDSDEYQAEIPLTGVGSADLPPVTIDQLSQVKRYRVRFPSTTRRSFKVRFTPYTFLTGSGPVQGLDLSPMAKYFSARRWMPLQWFSTSGGKSPLSLFGPYIAPLFAPVDVTQPITLSLYYHVRLQFAGQV